VNQLIQQQVAAGGPNASQQIQQNMQNAQVQMNQFKDKLNRFGASGDGDIPDFKPNNQKLSLS
jgi:ribosomal protein L11